MAIKLKIASMLQQYTEGKELMEVRGSTVRECLDDLTTRYPETRKWLFDANNSPIIWVLLNNEIVFPGDTDKKTVKEGDEISLIPVVAGG
jgi:molybdopterin converting factor small subunit